MIKFLARDGHRMFAFGATTDPLDVTVELAWAWHSDGGRQSLCNWACPTTEGSYCLDCHAVAAGAAEYARKAMS